MDKPLIVFRGGFWRVSPKPRRPSKLESVYWDKAHKWVLKHNRYARIDKRRQSPWSTP